MVTDYGTEQSFFGTGREKRGVSEGGKGGSEGVGESELKHVANRKTRLRLMLMGGMSFTHVGARGDPARVLFPPWSLECQVAPNSPAPPRLKHAAEGKSGM